MARVNAGDVVAGKYRIESVIGAGAMGAVVAAHHLLLDQRVAIKFLQSDALGNSRAVARLVREARAAARITSEHVARVFDVAVLDGGDPYIVMELLEGRDLAAWLRDRGRLPIDQAVDFVLQTCDAIAEAHALEIIHRDLKPANLFAVEHSGVVQTVKVLDFGISKTEGLVPPTREPADMGPASVITAETAIIGSPCYMSPEQMVSARDVDARADIWALGVTLCELITGNRPFDGKDLFQVHARITSGAPLRLREWLPELSPGLEAVLLKCLAQDREHRQRSVVELAASLVPFGSARAAAYMDGITRAAERGARLAPPAGTVRTPEPPVPAAILATLASEIVQGSPRPPAAASEASRQPPVPEFTPPRRVASVVVDDTWRSEGQARPAAKEEEPRAAEEPPRSDKAVPVVPSDRVRRRTGAGTALVLAAFVSGALVASYVVARRQPPAPAAIDTASPPAHADLLPSTVAPATPAPPNPALLPESGAAPASAEAQEPFPPHVQRHGVPRPSPSATASPGPAPIEPTRLGDASVPKEPLRAGDAAGPSPAIGAMATPSPPVTVPTSSVWVPPPWPK